MDGIREFLSAVRDAGLATGHLRALLHIAIGRTVTRADGRPVSSGVTWRALATELKTLRFDIQLVRELGAAPDDLAARDRERYWYSAIALAKVDSPEAVTEADKFAPKLKPLGFLVGPAPGTASAAPTAKPRAEKGKPTTAKEKDKGEKPGKKKKK
jgi:hypothetical protein